MNTRDLERIVAILMNLVVIVAPSLGQDFKTGGAADSAAMSTNELHSLVAPIALYPDPLVAQVLSAATFPDEVAIANYWLQQNKALTGQELMKAVNKQSWDVSVKALTQFPSVLDNMAKNLNWTSTLGEAYHNQASEVVAAIQTLRAQAKARGHLKSGPEITVAQQSPQVITIEPTNPQIVYVPLYDPALIYGTPYDAPGYTAGDVALGSGLGFGTGVAVGALAGGGYDCCGWGWGSWNCNWRGGSIIYNNNAFYGNRAWHGGYYSGGYHDADSYRNAYHRSAVENRGYASRDWNANNNWNRNLAGDRTWHSNSWAHTDSAFRSANAFSDFGDRFGGGWASRADSYRGWGSMRAGGFYGGRFGGGGFGGGRFGGFHGGFRR